MSDAMNTLFFSFLKKAGVDPKEIIERFTGVMADVQVFGARLNQLERTQVFIVEQNEQILKLLRGIEKPEAPRIAHHTNGMDLTCHKTIQPFQQPM